jgi:hypothetical protein
MVESSIVIILFGSFIGLLLMGAPITVALGVSALVSFLYLDENPIKFVQIAFTSVGSSTPRCVRSMRPVWERIWCLSVPISILCGHVWV